jgi:hypothetical protein
MPPLGSADDQVLLQFGASDSRRGLGQGSEEVAERTSLCAEACRQGTSPAQVSVLAHGMSTESARRAPPLDTSPHLFDHARNAEPVTERLEEQFGGILAAASL